MGTTNTRVWLVVDGEVRDRATAMVGVRDTARENSTARIRSGLRDLIAELRGRARAAGIPDPSHVVAAGMITSASGLAEVPHVRAPADARALAAAVQRHRFPDVTDLDVLLVPGVSTGAQHVPPEEVGDTDVMRGEETLCVGLLARGWLRPGGSLINLGSHWKAIAVDGDARIAASVTSLSGEMVLAAQTQTILASALPQARPTHIDQRWLGAGAREQRRAGLARALFCVRLLEQRADGSAEQRLSFLLGAFAAADVDALIARDALAPDRPVVISGGGPLAGAVASMLAERSIEARLLSEEETESALLAGLHRLCG